MNNLSRKSVLGKCEDRTVDVTEFVDYLLTIDGKEDLLKALRYVHEEITFKLMHLPRKLEKEEICYVLDFLELIKAIEKIKFKDYNNE